MHDMSMAIFFSRSFPPHPCTKRNDTIRYHGFSAPPRSAAPKPGKKEDRRKKEGRRKGGRQIGKCSRVTIYDRLAKLLGSSPPWFPRRLDERAYRLKLPVATVALPKVVPIL